MAIAAAEARWFACRDPHASERVADQPEEGFSGPGKVLIWLRDQGIVRRVEHPQLGAHYEGLGTELFIVSDDGGRPKVIG